MYEKLFKRFFDVFCSLAGLVVISPIFLLLTIIGAAAMRGNPFFCQARPGKIDKLNGRERIFNMIKFRTMDNRKDENGVLLPDAMRLNKYGRFLRSTSLDELPELLNILKGDMSVVGPRPQLVRDMVFMSDEQRKRHSVPQGLTGLAQVNGRNGISWEMKFEYDLEYIKDITFLGDMKIIFKTVYNVFKREGITEAGMATAEDFGDYLLRIGKIDSDGYKAKLKLCDELLRAHNG